MVWNAVYRAAAPASSMDPLRTERVLAALEWHRLLRRRDLVQARPASLRDLLRVHSADYLRALETPDSALRARCKC